MKEERPAAGGMDPREGGRPWVVATVTTADDLEWLRDHPGEADADVLEIRLDDLWGERQRLGEALKRETLPLLWTARHPVEGGRHGLEAGVRLRELGDRFRPGSMVDLELRTLRESPESHELAGRVRDEGGRLVVSHHDFVALPPVGERDRVVEEAREAGADIVKLAVVLASMEDLLAFARWAQGVEGPVAVMGMGPFGKLSRLLLGTGVSCLNYGYLQRPNAAGQWPAAELRRLLAAIRA